MNSCLQMVKLLGDRLLTETVGVGSTRVVAWKSSRGYIYSHHLAEIVPHDESHLLLSTIKGRLHRGAGPTGIRHQLFDKFLAYKGSLTILDILPSTTNPLWYSISHTLSR